MRHNLLIMRAVLNRRTSSALAALGTLAIVCLIALVATYTPGTAASDGNVTFAATWDTPELVAHLRSGGEVIKVAELHGVTTQPNGKPEFEVLAASLQDGSMIRITTVNSPSQTLAALSSIGYGGIVDTGSMYGQTQIEWSPFMFVFLAVGLIAVVGFIALFRYRWYEVAAGFEGSVAFVGSDPGVGRSRGNAAKVQALAHESVRFDDVAGCDEAKLELTEIVDFLRDPKPFTALGATIPRGILLWGPPGTGKTMLAKAAATEAGVAFISSPGSGFVDTYVGVGAKRIRELFERARKAGRAVIFIDEIDAVGKTRGGINSHDEREQALNQLLHEMDGFEKNAGIIVIAATNRIETLDPALLRPGRFSRHVNIPLPDVAGRRAILEVHAKGKPFADDADLDEIAKRTFRHSGASLANILNEAAILAARSKSTVIDASHLAESYRKSVMGTGRRRSMVDRERAIIAVHETGHAIVGKLTGERRRVVEITLLAHGEALGGTLSDQQDDSLPAERDLRSTLASLMGGRAAETIYFGVSESTPGASDDFDKATDLATQMVTRLGMGADPADSAGGATGRGGLSLYAARDGVTVPADIAAAHGRAIRALLDEAYLSALSIIEKNRDTFLSIAAHLYAAERMDGDRLDTIVDGDYETDAADIALFEAAVGDVRRVTLLAVA